MVGEIEERVIERIRREGPITFADFMDMALYGVPGGYYTSPRAVIGAQGDYYTSPTAHPVFGALLSMQFEDMWERMGCPERFAVVEVGAGKGLLAEDILSYTQELSPGFQSALLYLAVERAALRRKELALNRINAVVARELPFRGVKGCIFSNELLDSFPAHRVVQMGGRLLELYVDWRDGEFHEVAQEPSTLQLQRHLEEMGVSLREGQVGDVVLKVVDWMADVSRVLPSGFVLTIDYGHLAEALYSTERPRGTLVCYYKHTASRNPFVRIGKQDMTTHVNFSSAIMAGERFGLGLCGLTTQRDFLLNLGIQIFTDALGLMRLRPSEYSANRLGMMDLINPGGLGMFKVLMQSKGVAACELWGLTKDHTRKKELAQRRAEIKVPLLSPRHIPLLKAKYPHLAWDMEEVW